MTSECHCLLRSCCSDTLKKGLFSGNQLALYSRAQNHGNWAPRRETVVVLKLQDRDCVFADSKLVQSFLQDEGPTHGVADSVVATAWGMSQKLCLQISSFVGSPSGRLKALEAVLGGQGNGKHCK